MGTSTTANQSSLTPRMALAAGMVFIVSSDGKMDEVEHADLRKVVPDEDLLERALEYCDRATPAEFVRTCATLLSTEQKLCLLLNMADAAMVDGEIADLERQLLEKAQRAFEISDAIMEPYLDCLARKNDREIFG